MISASHDARVRLGHCFFGQPQQAFSLGGLPVCSRRAEKDSSWMVMIERNKACDPGRVFSAQLHKKCAKSRRLEGSSVEALCAVWLPDCVGLFQV